MRNTLMSSTFVLFSILIFSYSHSVAANNAMAEKDASIKCSRSAPAKKEVKSNEGNLKRGEIECDDTTVVSQANCLREELKNLDKELNTSYETALNSIPAIDDEDNRKGQGQLIKAQDAWIKYRNEQCDFEGGLEGGMNLWVSIYAAHCRKRMTINRIEFLRKISEKE